MLEVLRHMSPWLVWLLFAAENFLIMIGVLAVGNVLQRQPRRQMFAYSRRQWSIALMTCAINTVITWIGYEAWLMGVILISTDVSWRIFTDALALFLAMDLLMYLFHYLIHQHAFLYKTLHRLHHEATDPVPIDLFILHPLETLSFGALWLILLLPFRLNIYGIIIYLVINVFFGMMGHLGMEPIPENIRRWLGMQYLGTSAFHHGHHRHEAYNYGFYTTIWDRLFRTLRKV
ncbi:sterol desaturase family protein [Chitinophaga solisilvae]|uniref:sterol desaturase family protein n=1 Tax=Chitinophaga solisilvae TaxID=1233460 RepID=UPI00136CEDEF|nr:sterol desaturase family protein [Chitinophaga solisilvae]